MNLLAADLAGCAVFQTRAVQSWWIFQDRNGAFWKVEYAPDGWRHRQPWIGNPTGLRVIRPRQAERIRAYVKPVNLHVRLDD